MRTQTQSSGIWSRWTLAWESLGTSLGRGNAGPSSLERPIMGDFLLFSVWVSSYKVFWNKRDASDLGADLFVVKAAVSKVLKALQLAYTWAGEFWTTCFYQSLLSLFFLKCSLFKGWAGIICHPTDSLTRHYWCFLKSLLQLCGWLEVPNKIIPCTQMHMLWLTLISQF